MAHYSQKKEHNITFTGEELNLVFAALEGRLRPDEIPEVKQLAAVLRQQKAASDDHLEKSKGGKPVGVPKPTS